MCKLVSREVRVIGLHRREVGKHRRAVDALPPERMMRKAIGRVPRQLLGDEPFDAHVTQNLRQVRVVPEHVGQPPFGAFDPEVLLEEPLSMGELANERLTAAEVGIGLHPHPSHRNPRALGDCGADVAEHGRVVLAHPVVVERLAAREPVLWVPLDQRQLIGEGPGALATRLAQRPEPRCVDVSMADRGDPMCTRRRRRRQHRGQLRSTRRRRSGNRRCVGEVETVQHRFERAKNLVASRVAPIELLHQPVQRPHVVAQRLDLRIDEHEFGPTQSIQRRRPCGGEIRRRVGNRYREVGIRCSLEDQLHRLATRSRVGEWQLLVERVESAKRLPGIAGSRPEKPFALEPWSVAEPEVDRCPHDAASPLARNLSREREPGRSPRFAEHGADLEGLKGRRHCLRHADRLPRHLPPGHLQRDASTDPGRFDAFEHHSAQTRLDPFTIVVHVPSRITPASTVAFNSIVGTLTTSLDIGRYTFP